jgi:putative peptidoglycan lipid II flippase
LGMPFVGANDVLNRAFYGIQKTYLPLVVGGINLALNAGLDLLLFRRLGVGGITLSTSMVSTFNTFALLYLLRRQLGSLRERQLLVTFGRSFLATIPLCLVAWATWWALDGWLGRTNQAQLVSVGAAYGLGLLAYAGAARLLHMNELSRVVGLIRRRRDARDTEEVIREEDFTEP